MLALQVDPCVQEYYLLPRPCGSELDGVVVVIQSRQEFLQGWFPMGPDCEHIVYVPPPNKGLLVLVLEKLLFQLPHEDVGI